MLRSTLGGPGRAPERKPTSAPKQGGTLEAQSMQILDLHADPGCDPGSAREALRRRMLKLKLRNWRRLGPGALVLLLLISGRGSAVQLHAKVAIVLLDSPTDIIPAQVDMVKLGR